MQIYIDLKYIGRAMRHGRQNAKIRNTDAAKILGITPREYNMVERGRKLGPGNMMGRIMTLAFMQMRTRKFTGARELTPLKKMDNDVLFVDAD
ncbi:MAG: hypothetical protein K2I81_02950 [Alphaproteobacteria bacterium]|nr:hypothetical protein [Alphaproteobacteria bacterium]